MTHGTFVFADLSTLGHRRAKRFYATLFGWKHEGNGYAMTTGGTALYPMPRRFRRMGMPSFWMSYVAVDDVDTAVASARAAGGIVELGPEVQAGGRFALIRDPLGAGFTVWEGPPFGPAGDRLGHALFVSDAAAVTDFYAGLFDWTFGEPTTEGSAGLVRAIHVGDDVVAHLHEIPDPAVRGEEQYWSVLFPMPVGGTAAVEAAGGWVEASVPLPHGPAWAVRDPNGASFLLVGEAGGRADG